MERRRKKDWTLLDTCVEAEEERERDFFGMEDGRLLVIKEV